MVSSVLVVDDDPAFLMLVARILADIGVEVVDEAGVSGLSIMKSWIAPS